MDFLHWLEQLRTPLGDAFFSFITHFGEESLFLVAGLVFFWCFDKRRGYFLLFVGFVGTVLNQFLKLLFRVPRPWEISPTLSVVGNAKAEAIGYSFPSGHTQTAVGFYGGIARFTSHTWLRVACLILCVLVAFSRMYLGVHTPVDVGVSVVLATILVLGVYPLFDSAMESPRRMRALFLTTSLTAFGLLAFVTWFPFPTDIDPANHASGLENAYKLIGCFSGLWLAYEADIRMLHFDVHAVWWAQILKLVLGIPPLLLIRFGLKDPLTALFGGLPVSHTVRYFLIAVFAGLLWPMTFHFFGRLGKKRDAAPAVSESDKRSRQRVH